MNNKIFHKLQNSQFRCTYVPINNKKKCLLKAHKIMNDIIKKKIDFNNKKDLEKLSLDDLLKIEKHLKKKYQNKIKRIFSKDIGNCILNFFGEEEKNYRISVQIKYRWKKDEIKLRKKILYNRNGVWEESKKKPNICFPTRPHQDLSNNGFRSSSVAILYIPLTPYFKNSSFMEIGKFSGKHGLASISNKFNYANEIEKKTVKKIKWKVPKFLRPGNIFIMDSLTIHKSSDISEIPRIALNIKIQPKNLNYIYKNYNIKKNFKSSNKLYDKLAVIIQDLKTVSKKNNGFNFELAVANYLNNNLSDSMKNLKKLSLKNFSVINRKKTLVGGFVKKELRYIKINKNFYKIKHPKITPNSCAESIINTN